MCRDDRPQPERCIQIGVCLMNTRPLDWPAYVPYENWSVGWDEAQWPLSFGNAFDT